MWRVVNITPRLLYPRAHCIGGWVGPMAGLDGCGKPRPPPGFDPRTVQAVRVGIQTVISRPTFHLSREHNGLMTAGKD
jgi:hypothetical protein